MTEEVQSSHMSNADDAISELNFLHDESNLRAKEHTNKSRMYRV